MTYGDALFGGFVAGALAFAIAILCGAVMGVVAWLTHTTPPIGRDGWTMLVCGEGFFLCVAVALYTLMTVMDR